MKRYTQLFEGGAYSSDLLEAVLVPTKEVKEILILLEKNKNRILNKELSTFEICKILSSILKKYKIVFKLLLNDDEDNIFEKGEFNPKNNNIDVLCLQGIKFINVQNVFEAFINQFKKLIGHELVHRMQFIQRKVEKEYEIKTLDFKKYLSGVDEIMAYAWQAVEELRYRFGKDDEILKLLKTDSPIKYRVSFSLILYKTNFSLEDRVTKLLYKYMYMYLTLDEDIK